MDNSGLDKLFTKKTRELLKFARSLEPTKEINICQMTDHKLLKESAGGATNVDNAGNEFIYLDPQRTDEHKIAHELLHIIIHRSGWPRMYSMLPPVDVLARQVADTLDNAVDHALIYPVLEKLDIETTSYKERFISKGLPRLPVEEPEGPILCQRAFQLWEIYMLGESYKERAQGIANQKNWARIYELSLRLYDIVSDLKINKTKVQVREIMKKFLDVVDHCVLKYSDRRANLNKLIGITPLFKERDRNKIAANLISLQTQEYRFGSSKLWLIALATKKDNIRFRTNVLSSPPGQALIDSLNHNLSVRSLEDFLHFKNIEHSFIDSKQFDTFILDNLS